MKQLSWLQKQAFSEQVWVQLWLLFAVAERNHAVPGYKRLLCKTHTTVCAAQKLTQCSWKWFRSLIWIFYKIRHLIWLAGVVRDPSHEALLIMLFIYFLNFIALPRVQAWSGRVHAKDQPLRTNWIGNVQSVRERWCVRRRESCPKLWSDSFFAEDVVKPTLSVSLHARLYFPCEIIFRVGTILSADGIKPVVFSSLSRRQVNMA